MALQKSKPGLSEIINIKEENVWYKGWFLGARKGKFGFLYDFIGPKGNLFSLKGNSDIIRKLSIVPEKSWVELCLVGEEKQRSGNLMKIFDVNYDVDNKFNVEYSQEDEPLPDNLREPGQEG